MTSEKDLSYLALCHVASGLFARCKRAEFFAVILSPNGRVVGTGYNGSPPGTPHCTDGACPRVEGDLPPGALYDTCISIHAEQGAVMWSDRSAREGGTLYVNGLPCYTCAKIVAGSGIARLVCVRDDRTSQWPQARSLLEMSGVNVDEADWGAVILHLSEKTGYM